MVVVGGAYTQGYTVITRMIYAFRWAAMRNVFNASLTMSGRVKRRCPNITVFETERRSERESICFDEFRLALRFSQISGC